MDSNKNINSLSQAIQNFKIPELPKLEVPTYQVSNAPNLNECIKKMQERTDKTNQEKREREIENNENLKSLVEYNHDILDYNRKLVGLNEKILTKINSLDDTLLFLNGAIIDKSKSDEEFKDQHNALLLELINIIDSKDKGKLNKFMNGIGASVGAGLIVEYLKMKLGLS